MDIQKLRIKDMENKEMSQVTEQKKEDYAEFKIRLNQPTLKQIFQSTQTLVEDISINVSVEGLHIRTMDPQHIALIDIGLPNLMFEKYEVTKEGILGIRIDDFMKIINEFSKEEFITLELKSNLVLEISNHEIKYTMRLIEAIKSDCPMPHLPIDSELTFSVNDLLKYAKRINTISSYITITTTENKKAELSGKGDTGEIKISLEAGMAELRDIHVRQPSESTYSLEYILPYLKTLQKDLSPKIQHSTAKPMIIKTILNNIGRMDFYLAPRVEN